MERKGNTRTGDPSGRRCRRKPSWKGGPLILLIGVGLLFRSIHLYCTWKENPFTERLFSDALYYARWAEAILQGRGAVEAPFFQAPLYPYLLAGVRAVLGGILPGMLLLQAGLGLLSLVLLFRITARRFGTGAALAGGILFLGYGPFCFFEGKILVVTAAMTLGLLAVDLLETGLGRPGRPVRLAAAGLVAGLLCTARPNFLAFVLPAALYVLFRGLGMRRRQGGGKALLAAAAFPAALALPLAVTFAYNLTTGGEPVILTTNGGLNFYFGNHRGASGVNDVPSDAFSSIFRHREVSRRMAEEEAGERLTATGVSSWWMKKTLSEIAAAPGDWARLLLKKARLFLSSYEYGVIYLPESERVFSPVLRIQRLPAGFLLALGFLGLFFLGADHRRSRRTVKTPPPGTDPVPLLLFLAAGLATVLLFFMASRFRLPFLAGLLPFAGYGAIRVADQVRSGRRLRASVSLAWIGVFTALSFLLVDPEIRAVQYSRAECALSRVLADEERMEEARAAVRRALRARPTPTVYLQLGLLEEGEKNLTAAAAAFDQALLLAPRFPEALSGLARVCAALGDWNGVVSAREKLLELHPDRYEEVYNLGLAKVNAGDVEKGIALLRRAAEMAPGSADVWEGLGKALRLAGRPAEAETALERAIRLDPSRAEALQEALEGVKEEAGVRGERRG